MLGHEEGEGVVDDATGGDDTVCSTQGQQHCRGGEVGAIQKGEAGEVKWEPSSRWMQESYPVGGCRGGEVGAIQ